MKEGKTEDWFDDIELERQQDILEGLNEADSEETVPHVEAVRLFEKWGLK